jgi:hypothetical protein
MTAPDASAFMGESIARLSLFEFFTGDGLFSPHPAFDDVFISQVGLLDF